MNQPLTENTMSDPRYNTLHRLGGPANKIVEWGFETDDRSQLSRYINHALEIYTPFQG